MGTSSSQGYSLPKYEWTWVGNQTGIDLFKRQSDSLVAERRVVSLDHTFSLQAELEIYQFRSNNSLGLVKVYQVDGVEDKGKKNSKSGVCGCSESTVLSVFSQRIQFRLSDLPQLTFPESLHLLRQTVNSFHHVYQRFGPLHVNSQLIGINHENKVRVWVNENWALNHPSHKIPILLTINNLHLPPELRDEKEMVTNILQVIEEKTEQGRFPPDFAEGVYPNTVNFRELKRYLSKYIQQDYQEYIPEIIKRSRVLASHQQITHYTTNSLSTPTNPTTKDDNPTPTRDTNPPNNYPPNNYPPNNYSPNNYPPVRDNYPLGRDNYPPRDSRDNNLKVVQSMYQQYNLPANYSTQLAKVYSSSTEPATNPNSYLSNYHSLYKQEGNYHSSHKQEGSYHSLFKQESKAQHLATIPNTGASFHNSNNHNLLSNLPPQLSFTPAATKFASPSLYNVPNKIQPQRAPLKTEAQNFQYLKFKLLEDNLPSNPVQQLPQRHNLMLKEDLASSSQHKASYRILQGRRQAENLEKPRSMI